MSEAQSITSALRGVWHGGYGLCFCPAHHNTKTPALSVSDGNNGRLLLCCHAGCGFTDILDALKGLGLVEGQGHYSPPYLVDLASIREIEETRAKRQEVRALACWNETVPICGTIAETYLRYRGITCKLPDTLRFHPNCWHPTGERLPAMIARVEGGPRFAIHRTYLCPDGRGKAAIEPAKAMLGSVSGGAGRLSEGDGRLAVCEGVEKQPCRFSAGFCEAL